MQNVKINIPFIFLIITVYLIDGCTTVESNIVCERENCFTIIENSPFTDSRTKSGLYIVYGRTSSLDPKVSYVHLRYTDIPFYYRWQSDTLIVRSPYWKVVSNMTGRNSKFNFRRSFTDEENIRYGVGTEKFFDNVKKDFKELSYYQLKDLAAGGK